MLTKKTAVFLLQHFRKVYEQRGQSHIHQEKRYPDYKLAALDTIVNVKCLPAGYNTKHPPSSNTCDHCGLILTDGNVMICGHAYHVNCLQQLGYHCNYCKEYYMEGIRYNVSSFVRRLERGSNILTHEDQELNGEEEDTENIDEGISMDNSVMLELQRELHLMETW